MIKRIIELGKSLLVSVIATILIILFIFQTVSVEGISMEPTLKNQDRLIVEKVSYYFTTPKRGDIVVLKYPADPRERFIKRVIAVEGDRISIERHKLYLNGKAIEEPYIKEQSTQDYPEAVVPPGTVFVLGDNRNHSRDSRHGDVGFVSEKLLVGKAALRIHPFKRIGRVR